MPMAALPLSGLQIHRRPDKRSAIRHKFNASKIYGLYQHLRYLTAVNIKIEVLFRQLLGTVSSYFGKGFVQRRGACCHRSLRSPIPVPTPNNSSSFTDGPPNCNLYRLAVSGSLRCRDFILGTRRQYARQSGQNRYCPAPW